MGDCGGDERVVLVWNSRPSDGGNCSEEPGRVRTQRSLQSGHRGPSVGELARCVFGVDIGGWLSRTDSGAHRGLLRRSSRAGRQQSGPSPRARSCSCEEGRAEAEVGRVREGCSSSEQWGHRPVVRVECRARKTAVEVGAVGAVRGQVLMGCFWAGRGHGRSGGGPASVLLCGVSRAWRRH